MWDSTEGFRTSVSNWFANLMDSMRDLWESTEGFRTAVCGWFASVGNWFSDLGSDIGGWFVDLGSDIGGWFSNVFGFLGDLLTDMGRGFVDVIKGIGNLLNYLNPFSEDFLLWIALIPEDGFFDNYVQDFDGLLKTKFGFFYQIKDTMDSIITAVKSHNTTWQGIQIDLSRYGVGEIDIVDPYAIQQYGEKVRFWIGGFLLFFTGAWFVRKASKLLGEGR